MKTDERILQMIEDLPYTCYYPDMSFEDPFTKERERPLNCADDRVEKLRKMAKQKGMNDMKIAQGMPPRCGKSLYSQLMENMWDSYKEAHDKAYQQIFNQFKEDAGDEVSDEAIHEFIADRITFEVEMKKNTSGDYKAFIVPKWKQIL